ncbi:DMT family transporter [Paenibacillus sp. PAMC21692]|uniref:DMT family transporter n=1 Tax=Paenibacillus sp. PAMC21692 TaxID=2762320 RepID=UPI00164DA54D|nr:DMT family transporter [Paenibacillus sp. PAMC21692]QNK56710.1 DMT family transporter [Paenibacillus sp. PAMC21692]
MNRGTKGIPAYELLYVVGIIAISFSSIFVKWSEADVAVIAMYRLYLTNLLLLPFAWKYRRELFALTRKQWLMLGASGLMLGLHFLLWMASLRLTTVASSTVILTLEPVLVMLGSYWIYKTKANSAMLAGMGIAIIGSVMIGAGDFSLSGDALAGDILSFLGTVAVAAHMLIGKGLRDNVGAFPYNFWVFLFAATALAVYNVAVGNPFTGYSGQEWGLFLLLAIVPTLFGHYLFNWLLKYMNATAVSMSVLGEPVISSLLAWVLLKEALTGYQLVAGAFILSGVWLFIRRGQDRAELASKTTARSSSI